MTQKVAVLGAGIVGICTALSLAERGLRVTVIDRAEPGQETSYGNAGVISPWSIIPQAMPGIWRQIPRLMWGRERALSVRAAHWPRMIPWGLQFLRNARPERVREVSEAMALLCAPSIELFRRHLEGTGAEHLVRDSMYIHAFRDGSRPTLTSLDYAIRRENGAELELVGADALRRIEPALSHDFQAAVLIKGQARALSPGRICAVLTEKARKNGVAFQRKAVDGIEATADGWVIRCADERLQAHKVVLSLGVWSPRILEGLGIRVPLMAERGYHVEFANSGIQLENSVMDADAKFVASSMEGGLRLAGQAEFADVDAPPDPKKFAHLTKLAQQVFPDIDTREKKVWMGRRPSFPDSLPALGEITGHPGLFANFGHSHYGLMMAPKSGELIADRVAGTPLNADLSAFLVDRF